MKFESSTGQKKLHYITLLLYIKLALGKKQRLEFTQP